MATKKKTASRKTTVVTRTRSTRKVAEAVTTGAAAAVATVQQTQGRLHIASTSSAGTPGAKRQREVVVIRWDGDRPLSLKGWQVRDKRADHAYTFGDVTLKPHSAIRVHSGGRAAQDTESDVYWVRAKDVWNQESDVVHLLDARGIVHAQYIFEAATRRRTAKKKKVVAKRPPPRKPSVRKVSTKGKASGKLRIVARACRFVGPKNEAEQEVITIEWDGSMPLVLKGWKVYDSGRKHTYTFGDITLQAKSRLRLHTGGSDEVDTTTDVYWRRRNGVWNNEGDVVTVAEPNGKVHATYAYGDRGETSSSKPRRELRVKKATPTKEKPRKKVTRRKAARPTAMAAQTPTSDQTTPKPEAPAKKAKPRAKPSSKKKKTTPITPPKKRKSPPAVGPTETRAVPKGPQTPDAKTERSRPAPAAPAKRESAPEPTTRRERPMPSAGPTRDEPEKTVAPPGDEQRRDSQTPRATDRSTAPREPSAPPSGREPSDWKFTYPVVMLAIAGLIGGLVGASVTAMFAPTRTEVSLSEASLDELAASNKRSIEAVFRQATQRATQERAHRAVERQELLLAMSDVEKALERNTDAETLRLLTAAHEKLFAELAASGDATATVGESRQRTTSTAIEVAIAAVKRAKLAPCSEAGHAQRSKEIVRAIAAAQHAIASLSDDKAD